MGNWCRREGRSRRRRCGRNAIAQLRGSTQIGQTATEEHPSLFLVRFYLPARAR